MKRLGQGKGQGVLIEGLIEGRAHGASWAQCRRFMTSAWCSTEATAGAQEKVFLLRLQRCGRRPP
jgi:hypothetical protein